MKALILNGNHDLGGVIPWWVCNFSTNMEMLDLGFNSFHGTIRESLFYSKSLKYLDLGNNYLSGDPHDFFKPLVFLNLNSNSLLGTLFCFSASTRVSMVYLVHSQPRLQRQQRNQALFFLTCPTLVSLVVS